MDENDEDFEVLEVEFTDEETEEIEGRWVVTELLTLYVVLSPLVALAYSSMVSCNLPQLFGSNHGHPASSRCHCSCGKNLFFSSLFEWHQRKENTTEVRDALASQTLLFWISYMLHHHDERPNRPNIGLIDDNDWVMGWVERLREKDHWSLGRILGFLGSSKSNGLINLSAFSLGTGWKRSS
jgi:hypothetical protein